MPQVTMTSPRAMMCRVFVGAAGLAMALAPGACNILGPAYYLAAGPAKTPAMHSLEAGRPTVIFVDDLASILPRRTLRQSVARSIEKELLASGALTRVLDSSAVQSAALREQTGEPVGVVQLGRSVGAEVVIFVSMDRFGLTPDGQTFQPYAAARVKVVDVTKDRDQMQWPGEANPTGYPLTVTMPVRRASPPRSAGEFAKAQDETATAFGREVAKLFYKHLANEGPSKTR
jgi:hypothetical protein